MAWIIHRCLLCPCANVSHPAFPSQHRRGRAWCSQRCLAFYRFMRQIPRSLSDSLLNEQAWIRKGYGRVISPFSSSRGTEIPLVSLVRLQPLWKVSEICDLCWDDINNNPDTKIEHLLMPHIMLRPLCESFHNTTRYKYYCYPLISDEETEVSRHEITFAGTQAGKWR